MAVCVFFTVSFYTNRCHGLGGKALLDSFVSNPRGVGCFHSAVSFPSVPGLQSHCKDRCDG